MRASLSLNPSSFTRRLSVIPCAAGDVFQAVDVNMHAHSDHSLVDWGTAFVSPSQENATDGSDDGVITCRNCRCFVAHRIPAVFSILSHISRCVFLRSHSTRLDAIVQVQGHCFLLAVLLKQLTVAAGACVAVENRY